MHSQWLAVYLLSPLSEMDKMLFHADTVVGGLFILRNRPHTQSVSSSCLA